MNAQLVARIADDFVYEGSSFTYQNVNYDLFVSASGKVESCNCMDYRVRKAQRPNGCKHMRSLQRTLDARKAQAQNERIQVQARAASAKRFAELEAKRAIARKDHSFSLLA